MRVRMLCLLELGKDGLGVLLGGGLASEITGNVLTLGNGLVC